MTDSKDFSTVDRNVERQPVDYLDSTIYVVPDSVKHIGLGETMVQGTIIDRLYDAVHTTAEMIVLPVTDQELMFMTTNADILKLIPTILIGLPDVAYSLLFESQTSALPAVHYDDLRFKKDKDERQKPANRRNTSRNYAQSPKPESDDPVSLLKGAMASDAVTVDDEADV